MAPPLPTPEGDSRQKLGGRSTGAASTWEHVRECCSTPSLTWDQETALNKVLPLSEHWMGGAGRKGGTLIARSSPMEVHPLFLQTIREGFLLCQVLRAQSLTWSLFPEMRAVLSDSLLSRLRQN